MSSGERQHQVINRLYVKTPKKKCRKKKRRKKIGKSNNDELYRTTKILFYSARKNRCMNSEN